MKGIFKRGLLVTAVLAAAAALFVACGDKGDDPSAQAPSYDESAFSGSGIVGISGMLDMVGYGSLYGSSYKYYDDGSVALASNFFVPLRGARTEEGFTVSLSVERDDGVFDLMTEARNTGGITVKTANIFYRFFVVGVDDATSKLIVNGRQRQAYGTNYDYYERQYLLPLGNYCTGASLGLDLAYLDGAYHVTITPKDGSPVRKTIKADTAFEVNPGYSSETKELFEEGTKILGLQSMDARTKFSSVSFSLGNAASQSAFQKEIQTVMLTNSTPEGGTLSVSDEAPERGESVTVRVKPNEGWYVDQFTVNGINRKPSLGIGEEDYEYELIGIQTDTAVRVSFAQGEEEKHTVTGTYAYTSGVYDPATKQYKNEGDVLSVRAGTYEGVARDGRFSIDLPDGEYTLEIVSKQFPSAKKNVIVSGEATDAGNVTFKRLNFKQSVSYNADDSVTFSAEQTVRLFDIPAADEGFVVNYTVVGGSSSKWFDTGGLYMRNADGTFDYIFVFQSSRGRASAKAQIVLIESLLRRDNGPAYSTTYPYPSLLQPMKVTIAYYMGEFHIILDDVYACTINSGTALTTTNGKVDGDFFKAKPRELGLRNYDSTTTFSDISYALGNDAALKAIADKNIPVRLTAGAGGSAKLTNNGKSVSESSVQNIGAQLVATIVPEDGHVVKSFLVNGEESKSRLEGPFMQDGAEVYRYAFKAVKGGVKLEVGFEEGEKTLYRVRGTYEYDGVTGGAVSVKAGAFAGTAADGAFEIDLPAGTHIVTLYDGTNYVTKEVCVSGDTDAGKLTFGGVALDTTVGGLTEENGKFTIRNTDGGANFHPLTGISAEDGFVVSYTVTGTSGSTWFNMGAFYFEKNGVSYSVAVLLKGKTVRIDLQQPDVGNAVGCASLATPYEYDAGSLSVKVTIVYYKESLYFMLGDGSGAYVCEINARTKLNHPEEISSEFFTAGYRTLGFRAMDTAATFEDISYELGNDKALETLHGTFKMTEVK